MIAFDRDGTLIGCLGDFEGNHPRYIKKPEDQRLIAPIANWINDNGGILISNQAGIARGYTSLDRVILEFFYLHAAIPGLQASFFCPDEGERCWMILPPYQAIAISEKPCYSHLRGTYRKPQAGMFAIAADQFGSLDGYVGDLSGRGDYANGLDSDLQAAIAAGIPYWDVNEFLVGLK